MMAGDLGATHLNAKVRVDAGLNPKAQEGLLVLISHNAQMGMTYVGFADRPGRRAVRGMFTSFDTPVEVL